LTLVVEISFARHCGFSMVPFCWWDENKQEWVFVSNFLNIFYIFDEMINRVP